MKCWNCGKSGHKPRQCPDYSKIEAMSIEELKAEGFRQLEGGGLVHPDYLKAEPESEPETSVQRYYRLFLGGNEEICSVSSCEQNSNCFKVDRKWVTRVVTLKEIEEAYFGYWG